MARKKKRSWKAPKILWKIFEEKARSLATTISCIIPPLPGCFPVNENAPFFEFYPDQRLVPKTGV